MTEFLLLGRPSRLDRVSCSTEWRGSTASLMIASDCLAADRSPTAAALKYAPCRGSFNRCDPTLRGGALIPRTGAVLVCCCCCGALPPAAISLGILGTGGLSVASCDMAYRCPPPPLLCGRCGLGDLKLRSVIDAELPLLCSAGLTLLSTLPPALPREETEALRRTVRFVWTAETSVGVVGRALRAAAAAAEDKEGLALGSRRRKAERAAVAAEGFAVEVVRGCMITEISLLVIIIDNKQSQLSQKANERS